MAGSDGGPPDESAPRGVERITFGGAVAVLRPASIVIRPSRARLLGPAIEGTLAVTAAVAIATLLPVLPLWVLVLLLLVAIVLGPIAVLGVVYNVAGSSVLVERAKSSVRYQQGFLGLGIGTAELVPFWRIARIDLAVSDDEPLTSGDRQELVEWEVRLVKDNGRVLPIASAVAPRALAEEARVRAARLAEALAEMTGSSMQASTIAVEGASDAPEFAAPLPDPEHDGSPASRAPRRRRRRRRAV